MKDDIKTYSKHWGGTDHKGAKTSKDFEWYLGELAKPGYWGGKLELQILFELASVTALVTTSWGEVMEFNPGQGKVMQLYFNYNPGHWELVEGADPEAWRQRKRELQNHPVTGGPCSMRG